MTWQWAALLACAAITQPAPDAVTVTSDGRDTLYATASGACRITWTVPAAEIDRGVVRHHAECSLPPAEQSRLVSRLLAKVRPSLRTLYWGRLYPDGKPDPALAMRLALAAKRSPLWDARRGHARNGDLNLLARKLANDAPIYSELREVFRQAGLEIRVSAVEKVLVLPAAQLPFFDRFPKGEVNAADRLPFDCQTWFSVTRSQP